MRSFNCDYYHLNKDNKLCKNANKSCWASINNYITVDNDKRITITLLESKKDHIYIDNYIEPQITDEQRKRLIYLINKITPCKFVNIEGKVYIEYKKIKGYDNNLILLNFIRNLWCVGHSGFNYKGFFNDLLKRKLRNQDYLVFIMTHFKNNIVDPPAYQDHSNIIGNIIPKTKEELLSYTGYSTKEFLTSKSKSL